MSIINNIDDLSVDIYLRVAHSKDLKHLCINKELKHSESELKEAWEQINEEVLRYTGLSDKQQYMIEKQRELTLLMIEIMANDNEELLTQYNIEQNRLQEIASEDDKEGDIFFYIAVLEKYLGFQIDKQHTSVRQWLAYNKLFNKDNNGRESTTK
jgi:hypothetical protein